MGHVTHGDLGMALRKPLGDEAGFMSDWFKLGAEVVDELRDVGPRPERTHGCFARRGFGPVEKEAKSRTICLKRSQKHQQ